MVLKTVVINIGQLVRVTDKEFLAGPEMNNIQVENGLFALAIDELGKIKYIGTQAKINNNPDVKAFLKENPEGIIDAKGGAVLPGLVDGHTHPVWAGDRVHEFALKLSGASYMEVHKAGGGINFTVEKTREASEYDLLQLLIPRREVPIEISSTFCGAHSVPKGMSAEEVFLVAMLLYNYAIYATKDVIENQLPAVIKANKNNELNVENIDVFCEKGVFELEDSKKILVAGQNHNLRLNLHGDELYPLGGAQMGARLGAAAISHLEEIDETGITEMAKSGSVAVILPSTAYILRLKHPPVRSMIEKGVIVGLGTDFNPNAHCLSMPTIMHLGIYTCVNLKMSLAEALAAATINSAHSLGRGATHGSIQENKFGDLIVLKEKKWEHLIYQLGIYDL